MKTALRTVAGLLAGLALAFLLVVAVEMFSAVVHPVPEDFGGTTGEMCQHVERYTQWVLAIVVPMWAFTAFAGVWIAQKVGNVYSAAIVGLLIPASLVLNLSMLPYPIWFKIAILLAVAAAMLIAIRSSRPKTGASQVT